jgi:hypothetical protein
MKLHSPFPLTWLAFGAACLFPTLAATAAEPDADQLLRRMTDTLASAKTLSFSATREIDAALLEGRQMAEKARVDVLVQRPDKIAATAQSQHGTRRIVADGTTLSLLDAKTNHYATLAMRVASIDALVARLDDKYGFTPPLAEFALNDPYAGFRSQARTVTYLGRAKTRGGFLGLGGIECHRLSLQGPLANAELWIGVADNLPRQLIATFNRDSKPQLKIQFSRWNLNAPVTAADFSFAAPKGAEKIELWSTAQMAAAAR